jgi:hypothetical protein
MPEVRCWAIGIGEVRTLFAGDPAVRDVLVGLVEPFESTVTPARQPGLLGKLGPLLRRPPDAPVIPLGTPTRLEAEAIVHGRYIAEPRLDAAWHLVRRWLDRSAVDAVHLDLDDHGLDSLDFDLARAGVGSQHGVRHLWRRDASLPLRPAPGMTVGYLRHVDAVALGADWAQAVATLDGASAAAATTVVGFLTRLSDAGDSESGAGRPAPDVVTIRIA